MHTVQAELLATASREDQFIQLDLPELAIAGRSNVGKSSLINCLLGQRKLAQVSATPGRTRSINFYLVDSSWVFVDLPGYGYAEVSLEMRQAWQQLISAYLGGRQALQGVILIVDARRDPMEADLQLKAFLEAHGVPMLVVATKVDKLSKQACARQVAAISQAMDVAEDHIVLFSAVSQEGRQELWEAIRQLMTEGAATMKEVRKAFEEERRKAAILGEPRAPQDPSQPAGPRVIVAGEDGSIELPDSGNLEPATPTRVRGLSDHDRPRTPRHPGAKKGETPQPMGRRPQAAGDTARGGEGRPSSTSGRAGAGKPGARGTGAPRGGDGPRSAENRPAGARPAGGRPVRGEATGGGKPASGRPAGGKPASRKPAPGAGERSSAGPQGGRRSEGEGKPRGGNGSSAKSSGPRGRGGKGGSGGGHPGRGGSGGGGRGR